jgi:hypothetical protein
MKKSKKSKMFHTDSKQKGMGDFYGSGVRNPIGKVNSSYMDFNVLSKKKLSKPPKKLA